ncbi:MAG: SPOR domain-containing protein [Deltaproteobacteria bacterium]|nr:SPOR domain-containing protein [Nannocystaceae bacterium]
MRDIHKWKDKVELSLDNRQIFFLFFGLSVVGCFVFALGVMVGRRVDFDSVGEVEAQPGQGLAMLDTNEPTTYAAALRSPDPSEAPIAEPVVVGPADDADIAAEPDKPGSKGADKAMAGKPGKPSDKTSTDKPGADKADKTVMAAGAKASAPEDAAGRRFTLQMKAFAKSEEAEAFAAPLRSNGQDVRVEAHEIKGRIWHRVRMGEFDNWEDGLAAKNDFEKSEKMIAYVVRL